MKGHLYRITLERLEDAKGNPVDDAPVQFETRNHDNIGEIVKRMKARGRFPEDESAALAVGLKLFSEVMLNNKDHEIFKPLRPHFGEFMKGIKKK